MIIIDNILDVEKHIDGLKAVIFDLDDTLYSEKDYVRSGYCKIAEHLGREDAAERLWSYFEARKPAIDEYLAEIGEIDRKEECMSIYREQIPDIVLYDGVEALIVRIKAMDLKVGIITDGRPAGQRKKLKALGLDKLVDDIIVTDELGGVQFRKPCDIAFRIMQNKWSISYGQIAYVGDNPKKDFQAPRQLGMGWMYFKNTDGLYACSGDARDSEVYSVRESGERL